MREWQPKVIIVGGGFSGLATAFELQSRLQQASIEVLESSKRLGGMLGTVKSQEYLVDLGPYHFPGDCLGIMKLCHQLKLQQEMVPLHPQATRRFVLYDNTIQPLPCTLGQALTSPLFGMASAYHLVTERFRSHRSASNKHDESVYQFIERRAGKELADILADTLTTERFSSDGKVISIRAGFAEIFRAEREYGSVTAGYAKLKEAEKQAAAKAGIQLSSRNYALSEGMQTLVEALQARLANPPVCEVGVTSLQPAAEGMQNRWVVQCTDGQTRTADIVVLACSIPKQSALVADLDNELSDFMLQIPVAGIISLSLAYSRQHVPSMVDNHSIVIPQKLNKDIHKIEFISSVLPDRAPSGKVFMRLTLGGLARKEMLSWEEDALILAARRELRNLLRITKPPQFCHIQKWPRAIPQYTLGHQGRVQQIMERLKRHDGLYLAGNGYYGVTLSETATHAERIARSIRDYIHTWK